ncbi:MAG: glycosyltransferase N-terminal domain-containing protein [Alphaproteobacteria bacterium]
MLNLYQWATRHSETLLRAVLKKRVAGGKEDPARLNEREGVANWARPEGQLLWLHAASVGEAQSALILIEKLLALNPALHILVTTGTVTSAQLMEKKLPERAFHQFYPLDHPRWVTRFLDHWRPNMVLWMESELWPNMLSEIGKLSIPCALINARLSPRSYKRWRAFRHSAEALLRTFDVILTQTPQDKDYYDTLGAPQVIAAGNLKYSAHPCQQPRTILPRLKTRRKTGLYGSMQALIRARNLLPAVSIRRFCQISRAF